MQQIEILKGPQNTLFGRGAQIGAIHYISNKPTSNFYGNITAGMGNFSQKEINGAINIPVIKNKLMVRAAGMYDYNDGYIENTFGGNLNGKIQLVGGFRYGFFHRSEIKLIWF
jgi:iron complex outermembrane recepter protein